MVRTDYASLERHEIKADWRAMAARITHENRLIDLERYQARTGRRAIQGDAALLNAYIAQIEV